MSAIDASIESCSRNFAQSIDGVAVRFEGADAARAFRLAAPEFGPRRPYANLGRTPGSDDRTQFAIIWNPAD